jgi:hypothetical protein
MTDGHSYTIERETDGKPCGCCGPCRHVQCHACLALVFPRSFCAACGGPLTVPPPPQFELDMPRTLALDADYCTENDWDAVTGITTAVLGTDGMTPLVTAPDGYTLAADLLADEDGEPDGYRILVAAGPDAPWLASRDIKRAADFRVTADANELVSTSAVITDAVAAANGMLAWLRALTGNG